MYNNIDNDDGDDDDDDDDDDAGGGGGGGGDDIRHANTLAASDERGHAGFQQRGRPGWANSAILTMCLQPDML